MKRCTQAGLITAGAAIAAGQLISNKIYKDVFFKRSGERDCPWEKGFDEFPNLKRRKGIFPTSDDITLVGYFYYDRLSVRPIPESKGIIILAPGFLQSHKDYLSDIDAFVKAGFVVFAYDNMGCYESGGSRILGIDQAVVDLRNAISYVEDVSRCMVPICLYGHSMGAYACASVLGEGFRIRSVVLRSGFYSPVLMIHDVLHRLYGFGACALVPFTVSYRTFLFGKDAWKCAVREIRKFEGRVLILHSEDDPVVSLKHSIYGKKKKFLRKETIYTRMYFGKGHDIVRDDRAMRYYFEKEAERKMLTEEYGGIDFVPAEKIDEFYRKIDKKRANLYDAEVMEKIVRFFQLTCEEK